MGRCWDSPVERDRRWHWIKHARFQLAPIGRFAEQIERYSELLKPGGVLILEDPDTASWKFTPDAPSANRLIELILAAFVANQGNLDELITSSVREIEEVDRPGLSFTLVQTWARSHN